jgi:tripartite-type tricarboxylate transporter receptor subunit TctC
MLSSLVLLVAPAAGADDFYKGRTLTLYVGYAAGDTYDVGARLLARHYGRYIPGNPTVVVKNMPGSSSLKLTNYLYNVVPKDGLTIGSIRNGMLLEPLYNNPAVRYDALKFNWLGSMASAVGSCVIWHTAPAKTLDDVKKIEIVSGAIGTTASLAMYPRALNAMIGTKFKVVTGYTGTGTLHAMERGETHARCGGDWDSLVAIRPHWIRDRQIRLLAQMSNEKHPDLMNEPWVFDYVKKPEDVQVLRLIFASQEWGRPFVAPPSVPAGRVAALRKAFMTAVNGPELKADGARLKMTLRGPLSGEEMQKRVAEYHKTPQSVIDRIKSFQKATASEGKAKGGKKK